MKLFNLVLALCLSMPLFAAATGDVAVGVRPDSIKISQLKSDNLKSVDLNLTAAQMDTLNATPVTAITAPAAGYANQVISTLCKVVSTGLTAFELGSGTVDFRYTNSSGGLAAQLTNAFVENSTDAAFQAYGRDAVVTTDAAVVAYASADVTAGTGSLNCRLFYRVVRLADI